VVASLTRKITQTVNLLMVTV